MQPSPKRIKSRSGITYTTGEVVQEGVVVNDEGGLTITLYIEQEGKMVRRNSLPSRHPDSYHQIWYRFTCSPFPSEWRETDNEGPDMAPVRAEPPAPMYEPEPSPSSPYVEECEEVEPYLEIDEPDEESEPGPVKIPTQFHDESYITPAFSFIWSY